MAKSLGRLATAVALAILIVLAYLGVQVVERFLRATDRRFGDDAYNVLAVALAIVAGVVFAGWFFPWLRRRWISSGFVYPDDHGIMPAVPGKGNYQNINPYGVQHLRALGPADNISAAKLRNVVRAGAEAAQWEPVHQPAQIAAPEPDPANPEIDFSAPLPRSISLYSAPLPRQLSLPVGVDAGGRQVAIPLRDLGNVLIGGRPKGGKSELLADFIAGLARQDATGLRVQLAVIDMKLVSFGNIPPDLPILRWPVAIDTAPALELVDAVLEEVRRRYEMLQRARVRSLDSYVQKTGEPLPHLVTIIDEIADLSARRVSRSSFNEVASEIARKGRAAGVTLIMATQRPSTEILPADLRNLEGVAIAFSVDRWEDSKLILGQKGAELLPSIPGRCLVRAERTVVTQAYLAGLDEAGGHSSFDAFLAGLPRADAVLQPPKPAVPLVPGPVYPSIRPPDAGIPVFGTDDRDSAYTPAQQAHILALFRQSGSLKEVQRTIYPDQSPGGHWWYRIREVVHAAGFDTTPAHQRRRHRRGARE